MPGYEPFPQMDYAQGRLSTLSFTQLKGPHTLTQLFVCAYVCVVWCWKRLQKTTWTLKLTYFNPFLILIVYEIYLFVDYLQI